MTLHKRMIALVGALGLTLMIAVAAVAAAGATGASAAGATGQGSATDFLAKLAANLGIGQDQLTEAVKQTNLQLIDEAVAAGTMTADQAQAARDRINNSADGGGFGVRPSGGRGDRGGFGGGALHDTAATYFGITTDQFRQDLADAGTLQGVAAKYGKDNDAGKAGLKAALEAALRQQLTDKGINAAQIDQRVNEFSQNFDQYYTQQAGGRGPRGPQPTTSPSASPAASQ